MGDQVTSLASMFESASAFNVDISSWKVNNVNLFTEMFKSAVEFNQNVNTWTLTTAATITSTNAASPVLAADVMKDMFNGATKFQQNLCGWGNELVVAQSSATMFSNTKCPVASGTFTADQNNAAAIADGDICCDCNVVGTGQCEATGTG